MEIDRGSSEKDGDAGASMWRGRNEPKTERRGSGDLLLSLPSIWSRRLIDRHPLVLSPTISNTPYHTYLLANL
jgi:hypothetical protein